jgi:hypothetical protein
VTDLRFTETDAERASDQWGCNCGPSALAAITGRTLDEIRPLMGDFERKRYTNPTLMFDSIKRTAVPYWTVDCPPTHGLCRVQWEGPWTEPGVPIRVRYRHTHWIGIQNPRHSSMMNQIHQEARIFDINAMCVGGWIPYAEWATSLVPWLLKQCEPKANGRWHITHRIEVGRPNSVDIGRAERATESHVEQLARGCGTVPGDESPEMLKK